MMPDPTKPLIVNSDFTVMLEVRAQGFRGARDSISRFLELLKSPDIFHTYQMNEVSLWNGFSVGLSADAILAELEHWSKFAIPDIIANYVREQYKHYGIVKLRPFNDETIELYCEDEEILNALAGSRELDEIVYKDRSTNKYLLPVALRGVIKLEMVKMGFPVEDQVGFLAGENYPLNLKRSVFNPRPYQEESMNAFFGSSDYEGGAGIIVLPCGAGKTVVGIMAMARLGMKTLIITPNIVSLRQWKTELIEKTDIRPEDVGEYSGELKTIRPITIATYQILVYRSSKEAEFEHLGIFSEQNWGLVVYDEVHLLPAPVFRTIASIQAKRRLGLTATLIREDGREKDVFALIGPKKFDMPWKELEAQKYIANAICYEIRVKMPESLCVDYYGSAEKGQFRLAAENPEKNFVIEDLLKRLKNHQVLIIGQFLNQLYKIAEHFDIPIITGKTPNEERMKLYAQFRRGEITTLAVSKVANFAIDLPDADVAIQVSGTYGSRQEEAQRLGRIIRPKEGSNQAYFFTVVTNDSREEIYAHNRKRFLMEQGYEYKIIYQDDLIHNNISLHD